MQIRSLGTDATQTGPMGFQAYRTIIGAAVQPEVAKNMGYSFDMPREFSQHLSTLTLASTLVVLHASTKVATQ
jgi:hypothetical protein